MALMDWITTWGITGRSPAKPHALSSDKAVYDFCRSIYNEKKGPTPELREALALYKKKTDAGRAHTEFRRRAG